MEYKYSFLAQAAESSGDGKFYVLGGGIDRLGLPFLPATVPALSVITEIVFTREECGHSFPLLITATDPDGEPLSLNVESNLCPVLDPHLPETGCTAHLVTNLRNIMLTKVGNYSLNFLSGDKRLGAVIFHVVVLSGLEESG